nr:hypothetical protein CFP56_73145 [Quercus suber]
MYLEIDGPVRISYITMHVRLESLTGSRYTIHSDTSIPYVPVSNARCASMAPHYCTFGCALLWDIAFRPNTISHCCHIPTSTMISQNRLLDTVQFDIVTRPAKAGQKRSASSRQLKYGAKEGVQSIAPAKKRKTTEAAVEEDGEDPIASRVVLRNETARLRAKHTTSIQYSLEYVDGFESLNPMIIIKSKTAGFSVTAFYMAVIHDLHQPQPGSRFGLQQERLIPCSVRIPDDCCDRGHSSSRFEELLSPRSRHHIVRFRTHRISR